MGPGVEVGEHGKPFDIVGAGWRAGGGRVGWGGMEMGSEWAWVQWVVGSGPSLPICPAATGALPVLC